MSAQHTSLKCALCGLGLSVPHPSSIPSLQVTVLFASKSRLVSSNKFRHSRPSHCCPLMCWPLLHPLDLYQPRPHNPSGRRHRPLSCAATHLEYSMDVASLLDSSTGRALLPTCSHLARPPSYTLTDSVLSPSVCCTHSCTWLSEITVAQTLSAQIPIYHRRLASGFRPTPPVPAPPTSSQRSSRPTSRGPTSH